MRPPVTPAVRSAPPGLARPPAGVQDHDEVLTALLRQRGQRVTPQRLVVHRILRARQTHLHADEVFAAVRGELPGTSLPTIYATLDLFAELGLVQRVRAGGRSALYDTRVEPHGHAICRSCETVIDLELGRAIEPVLDRARAGGFVVDHADAWVSGLCPRCAPGA